MRRRFRFFGKSGKGFTLMECVCAIAIVGLLSALLLPLTSSAIISMKTSDSLRKASMDASQKNATVATVVSGTKKNVETMYVTVQFSTMGGTALSVKTESAFVFTKSEVTGNYDVKVTYYDLKYGKEMVDPEFNMTVVPSGSVVDAVMLGGVDIVLSGISPEDFFERRMAPVTISGMNRMAATLSNHRSVLRTPMEWILRWSRSRLFFSSPSRARIVSAN